MKWTVPAFLVAFLTLLPGSAGAHSTVPFFPSFNVVSVNPSGLNLHGNVSHSFAVPSTDHGIGYVKYTLPVGWDVANVQSGNDEPIVGTGTLRVDVGPPVFPACDGVQEVYPLTIVDVGQINGDPPHETNWFVQGYIGEQFQLVVKGSAATGQTIEEARLFDAPGPAVCSPMSFDLTFQGVSSENPGTPETGEGGRFVLTNPGSNGVYTWSVQFKSLPLGAGEHTLTRCDQVGIGNGTVSDPDGDSIGGTCDNCPTTSNNNQRDWDLDNIGDVCDSDSDGDGVANGSDQCAFTVLTQRPVDANGCSQAQVDQDLDGLCDPGKSSPTLCTGSDNCPTAGNPNQANVVHPLTTAGDACEDPDSDGWVDNADNCPDNFNQLQEDNDLDGRGNPCDPCSADPDCDNDNVSDGPADPDAGGPIVAGPDNCVFTANTNQLNQDADTLGNACDNCPTNTNQDQLNIDGDSFGDACDAGDFDLDGFSDRVEYAAGTDRGAKCPSGPTHNAWPADINNNGFSDISDVSALTGSFGLAVPPAPARYNIAPDPVDGFVDVTDIARMVGLFGAPCPP